MMQNILIKIQVLMDRYNLPLRNAPLRYRKTRPGLLRAWYKEKAPNERKFRFSGGNK